MSACSSTVEFNKGRGAWNAAEHFYQPPHIKRKYQAALDVMTAGDMEKAAEAFEKFDAKYPDYPGAYVNLAIIYEELERPEDADIMLEKAKDLIPGYVIALNQEGLIKRRRGDFAGAEQAWLAATESDPEFANAWYNLGVLYDIYLRDLPSALVAYQNYQDIYLELQRAPGGELASHIIAEPDKQVLGWVSDVERRIDSTQQSQQAAEIPRETSL
ncbi:MAG: tetratricopeptide repeat protein [Gammaproteobacteria bacterium]